MIKIKPGEIKPGDIVTSLGLYSFLDDAEVIKVEGKKVYYKRNDTGEETWFDKGGIDDGDIAIKIFETNKIKIGDIVSFKGQEGLEYGKVSKIGELQPKGNKDIWCKGWFKKIEDVNKLGNETWLGEKSVELVKPGKFDLKKMKESVQIKDQFIKNKRKAIIKEIEANKNYSKCFDSVEEEVNSWDQAKILNWKLNGK